MKLKLNEVMKVIDNRILLWLSHGCEGQLASPYSHLSIVGELRVIKEDIKRLESQKNAIHKRKNK